MLHVKHTFKSRFDIFGFPNAGKIRPNSAGFEPKTEEAGKKTNKWEKKPTKKKQGKQSCRSTHAIKLANQKNFEIDGRRD